MAVKLAILSLEELVLKEPLGNIFLNKVSQR